MDIRRHILGIISLCLLTAWIAGLFTVDPTDGTLMMLSSVCMRSGLVLGALWLALPQVTTLLSHYQPWQIGLFCVGLMAVVYRPRLFVPIVGAFAVLHFAGWIMRTLQGPAAREPRSSKKRS